MVIAELVLVGLLFDWIFQKFKLPGLIGLLFVGIAAGHCGLNILTKQIVSSAVDLTSIALVVILLRAGLEISRQALAKVGSRAVLLAFLPCCLEVATITIAGPWLLGFTYLESAILGGVLAAVSPAVVVPLMVKFIREKRGADKGIPTLVLAGASVDDAVAIVLCTSFIGIYISQETLSSNTVSLPTELACIPVSVITGILVGLIGGVILYKLFDKFNPRATKRVIILVALAFLLKQFEYFIVTYAQIPFSALIAIMSIGFIILEKREHIAHEISAKLGKLWIFAQLILFMLVGASVDVNVAMGAGLTGAAIIALGLLGRTIGVQICLFKSPLNKGERLFVTLSYLPKATVQAAIGATPLIAMQKSGLNTAPGEIILAIAVLSILLTAPLGAFAISYSGKRLLTQSNEDTLGSLSAVKESNPE